MDTTDSKNRPLTKNELSYDELKPDLTKELSERRWNKREESLHCYVLNIQGIARSSDATEIEVIDFIIQGIGVNITNVNLLHGVGQLKK